MRRIETRRTRREAHLRSAATSQPANKSSSYRTSLYMYGDIEKALTSGPGPGLWFKWMVSGCCSARWPPNTLSMWTTRRSHSAGQSAAGRAAQLPYEIGRKYRSCRNLRESQCSDRVRMSYSQLISASQERRLFLTWCSTFHRLFTNQHCSLHS